MTTWSRKKVNASVEKTIITGMIVSKDVLTAVSAIWEPRLMKEAHLRRVGSWAIEYWERYSDAPGAHIQSIFEGWLSEGGDEDEAQLIGKLLSHLSTTHADSSEAFNAEYVVDQAEQWFRHQGLLLLTDEVERLLVSGEVLEAESRVALFHAPKLTQGEEIDLLNDDDILTEAFAAASETVFSIPGTLGRLMNPMLTRDAFVALMGPEKRGKTWWLIYLAIRAVLGQCNVAFFAAGDMTRNQMIRRIAIHLGGRSDRPEYAGGVLEPCLDCHRNQDNSCENSNRVGSCGIPEVPNWDKVIPETVYEIGEDIGYEPCPNMCRQREFSPTLWWRKTTVRQLDAGQARKYYKRMRKKSPGRKFMLDCWPAKTLRVRDIENKLDIWEKESGFIPDVILVDYADIMSTENNHTDSRHGHDEVWARLRSLSQARHCLVLTATQTDADSYDRPTLGLRNFSEDKRKYGHVTSMFTLNQTPGEKKQGIMRIGALLAREEDVDTLRTVTVLQSIQRGRPHLASYYRQWNGKNQKEAQDES